MGFFKNLLKTFSSEKYRRHPDGSTLTPQRFAAINVGAVNGEQTMSYCDSLSTGNDVEKLRDNLKDYYGITDHASAEETLRWLLEGGHTRPYFLIREHAAGVSSEPLDLSSLPPEARETLEEYLKNLQETAKELTDDGWISSVADYATIDISAWDYGRAVIVTRSSFDCGYLSEDEAWSVIDTVYEAAKNDFADWRALAQSYIVGRAMWGGDSMMLTGLSNIAANLLTEEGSPWKDVPLKV